ncbi:L,D-transpeptidase family protein [Paracoccus sp. M683]|uniref:L,D-transpeptidase family protein n=1 Tax=Paracoccus sp. M683 TaxID=2594268 RepID=UPI00117C68E2|nr:L,D-transpeptidase family protein [Paracoccus sp. M683]TRW96175.1 L,D-transpeptidase family protein [Paracoccus sp. M683]
MLARFGKYALVVGLAASVGPLGLTGAAAQGLGAATAVAPRLEFTGPEMELARAVAGTPGVAAFYGENGLKPIFGGIEGQARRDAVIAAIRAAHLHGLPTARYRLDQLTSADPDTAQGEALFAQVAAQYLRDVTSGAINPARADNQIHRTVQRPPLARLLRELAASADPSAFMLAQGPSDPRYHALRQALAARTGLIAPVDAPLAPEGLWRVGMRSPQVPDLRARLTSIGFQAVPPVDPSEYDAALADAVIRYQQAVGLPADGVAGPKTIGQLNGGPDGQTRAILVAMERMRWMNGHDLNARHVWVNIPEFTARIYDGGQQVFQTRTVVGKTDNDMRTPEFSDEMEYVVVNPRWNVPRSITVREYLPRLQRNRYAVAHLDVIDGRGNVVSRDRIDFGRYTASNFPYRMRQKPSDDNALGLVKFIFPNQWNIYLHDTPTKHLFGQSTRAYSHGCIRIGDPFDLAYELLSQQTDDPRAMFQRALATGNEQWLKLKPALPVHLVYFTAMAEPDGQIRFYKDIYGRDARVWQVLAKAGLELDVQSD